MNAASTSRHLPLLHSINGYASGGLVGSQTALSGRNALSLGPELSQVVSALADIAQAVRDARDAVAPKRDLEAQAWSARNAAKQLQWDNRVAAQNRLHAAKAKQGTENGKTSPTERLIDRQKVTAAQRALAATVAADNAAVAKTTREWAMARRTATSYANAATAAERFQSAQQRAYRAQQTYAAQVDKLNGWLTDRSAKLGQLRSERANMMGGISSTVAGFDGGILGHPDTRNTFATILKGQQYDVAQAQKFNVNITKLRKLGLSNGSLNSIASAGVDGGGVTAAALAKATPAQIKQLSGTVNQMHRIGDNVGNVVGGAFYDAGIQSATGFVKGLQSQIGAIQKAMNGYAGAAVGALTRKLQTHSPSRVTHELGVHTAAGFTNGVLSGYGDAHSAMAGMVQVPQPYIPQQNFGRSSAAPSVVIKVAGSDSLSQAVASMITAEIDGFTVNLGHSFEKAGMQR